MEDMTTSMPVKDDTTLLLNALLQRAAGDIDNLHFDDLQKLQKLCTAKMLQNYCSMLSRLYPGNTLLGASLLEEMHQRRTTQRGLAQAMGLSYQNLNKIVGGHTYIGIPWAKAMLKLGIDGNFIIANARE